MEVTFKKKALDEFLSFKFKTNYWLLRNLGLVGYGFSVFLYGVVVTIVVYEFFL